MNYHLHENGWTVILDDFDFAAATREDIDQIACLLATNTCVVAHKQTLTLDDELRVAHMFGEVEDLSAVAHLEPYNHILMPDGQNKIERVTGELDEHGQPGLFGHVSDLDWHCNMPGDPKRKALVWLLGVRGTAGSRTSWTNNIAAYNDLSPATKDYLKTQLRTHRWDAADMYFNIIMGASSHRMGIVHDRLTTQADGYSLIDKTVKTFRKK